MRRSILLLFILVAFALPTSAAASASIPGPMCDVIASLPLQPWYALEKRSVTLDDGTIIRLTICSEKAQDLTAREKVNILATALPHLSRSAGLPLRGASERRVYLVPISDLHAFNADGMVNSQGEMYLHDKSSPWVVAHEGAHYWANELFFSPNEPWLIEGYAEYLAGLAMQSMGYSEQSLFLSQGCEQLPLTRWQVDLPGRARCGYAVGSQVFRDLATIVGPDQFRITLRRLSERVPQIDSWSLLVAMDLAGQGNVASLMQQHVFPPQEAGPLAQWRAFRSQITALEALRGPRAQSWPQDMLTTLDRFDRRTIMGLVAPWIDQVLPLAREAAVIEQRCHTLDLACPPLMAELPATDVAIGELTHRLAGATALLDKYAALHERAGQHGVSLPKHVVDAMTTFDEQAAVLVDQALLALDNGLELDARCKAQSVPCEGAWRSNWEQGQIDAAERQISDRMSLLNLAGGIETLCTDLRAVCHNQWVQAFQTSTLMDTVVVLNKLRAALKEAGQVEQRCETIQLRPTCHGLWGRAFQAKGQMAMQEILRSLNRVLDRAAKVERDCGELAQSCRTLWVGTLGQGIAQADTALADLDDLLARAQQITMRCKPASVARCSNIWVSAFKKEGPSRAQTTLAQLGQLMDHVDSVRQACQAAGWPCEAIGDHALRQDELAEADTLLVRVQDALPQLKTITTELADMPSPEALSSQATDELGAARDAWVAGQPDQALQLAEEVRQRRSDSRRAAHRRRLITYATIGLAVAGLCALGLLILHWISSRKRPINIRLSVQSRTMAPPDDLLAELLARPAGPDL